MPIPPYGVAIREAIAQGDLKRMREVEKLAEEHLGQTGNLPVALELLKAEIAKLELKGPKR